MAAMVAQWLLITHAYFGQPQQQSPLAKKSFSQLFSVPDSSPLKIKAPTTYKGKPSVVFFSQKDIAKASALFHFAIVGKFSHGRPKIEDIQKFFASLNLKIMINMYT